MKPSISDRVSGHFRVPTLVRALHAPTTAQRAWVWLTTAAIVVAGWHMSHGTLVRAQEDRTESETLDKSSETLTEPDAALSETRAARPAPRQRTMMDTLKEGGTCGVLIGILSVIGLGFIIEHIITIRKDALMPEGIANELEIMIRDDRIDEAVDYCRDPANESLIAEVVYAGLQRYRSSEFGFAEYKAAVEEAGEDQTGRLYRKTEVLGVIAAIAPMLGLQGTVIGMIESFNLIASTGGAARPDELAGGIGKALVTTMEGLFVAIPAMMAFSYFRNRIDSVVAETGKRVEQIMMPLGRRR